MTTFPRRAGPFSLALNGGAMVLSRAWLVAFHRYSITGREHLPRHTPFVMIANHTSHLDHMCLRNALPLRVRVRTHPLAAGDVFFTSALRSAFSTHVINALPIWRKKATPKAMAELRAMLVRHQDQQPSAHPPGGCGIVMFPEGARSEDGEPARFKAGIGMLVAGTPVPVVPAWIQGAGGPGGALQKFRVVPRPTKITVHVGPPLRFESLPNDRDGWDRVIAELESRVRSLRPVG